MKPYSKFGKAQTNFDNTQVSLQMEFVTDFEKSFLVKGNDREIYIPRSLVEYRRKFQNLGQPWIEFTLPQWKVTQEKLDKYVIP